LIGYSIAKRILVFNNVPCFPKWFEIGARDNLRFFVGDITYSFNPRAMFISDIDAKAKNSKKRGDNQNP
jgi:hypothetical protein